MSNDDFVFNWLSVNSFNRLIVQPNSRQNLFNVTDRRLAILVDVLDNGGSGRLGVDRRSGKISFACIWRIGIGFACSATFTGFPTSFSSLESSGPAGRSGETRRVWGNRKRFSRWLRSYRKRFAFTFAIGEKVSRSAGSKSNWK